MKSGFPNQLLLEVRWDPLYPHDAAVNLHKFLTKAESMEIVEIASYDGLLGEQHWPVFIDYLG